MSPVRQHAEASPGLTFTVNSTGDTSDANAGDGICDDGTGSCTLRAAIEEANASAGADIIAFNVPGVGLHTIQPSSALPTVTDPVVIDGYTQPGATPNTLAIGDNAVLLIELKGRQLYDSLYSTAASFENLFYSQISDDERLQLRSILSKLKAVAVSGSFTW